jgi:hypothetical protein
MEGSDGLCSRCGGGEADEAAALRLAVGSAEDDAFDNLSIWLKELVEIVVRDAGLWKHAHKDFGGGGVVVGVKGGPDAERKGAPGERQRGRDFLADAGANVIGGDNKGRPLGFTSCAVKDDRDGFNLVRRKHGTELLLCKRDRDGVDEELHARGKSSRQ